MMPEFNSRIRFVRLAGISLLCLFALWLLVALPLWLGNQRMIGGVPALSPVESRLAMPEQAVWGNLYGYGDNLRYGQLELPESPVKAMGRGLVRLDEDGEVQWEVELEGQLRLAQDMGSGLNIRTLEFSDEQNGQCRISAWSPAGELLWQRDADLPSDCLARVDDSGELVLVGRNGQQARISADGQRISVSTAAVDLRFVDRLPGGEPFTVYGGELIFWDGMLREQWRFRPQERALDYAAGSDGRLVAMDGAGFLYCLDRQGKLQWRSQAPVARSASDYGYHNSYEYRMETAGTATVLFMNSAEWRVYGMGGELLWQGRGSPYFNNQQGSNVDNVFTAGPDGRRCFKGGDERIRCVDSEWRELWSEAAGPAAQLIHASDELLLIHENSRSLRALDWDGKELWMRQLTGEDGFVRTVLHSGGLTTMRSYTGMLTGIGNDGSQRFSMQLDEDQQYDLAADGEHIYVQGSNVAGHGNNWLMGTLREALHITTRFHVDCYSADGRRLWRAYLPDRMMIERLQRDAGGGLSVVATPLYDYSSMSSQYFYTEWEFLFRQPEG